MLADFAEAVKDKKAKKLSYDLWRPLYLWSKPDSQYEQFSIHQVVCGGEYVIGPHDNRKATPNPVTIHKAIDNDFWEHVNQEYIYRRDEDMTMQQAFVDIQSNCSNMSNSLNSISNTLDSAYWIDDSDWNSCKTATGTNGYYPTNIELTPETLIIEGKPLEEYLKNLVDEHEKEKEKKDMKFNFDFGPVDSSVRMSMYGMAIKNASGTYVAYDAANKQIMDVDIFNFEGANKFIYKMPAALKDVRSGDVVIHARKPMFVQVVQTDGRLKVLDIFDGEEKTIVLAKSPFGFDFVTKVVSLVNMTGVADAENPFGNMLPFLLMGDGKMDDMLPLALMAGGNMDMSNPMMMYALMGNRTNDPMMLALAMGAFNKPAHTCACGGNCHCDTDK